MPENENQQEEAGPVKLDEETKARLARMEGQIANARRAIQTMKKIGMDTSEIEDKLEWAEETRKTLLSEFS